MFFIISPSRKKYKYTISKYITVCYEQQETTSESSKCVSFPVLQDFNIFDSWVSEPLTLPSSDEKLYTETRPIQKKKIEQLMTLTHNYVPKADMWFYDDIERSFQSEEHQSSLTEHRDGD